MFYDLYKCTDLLLIIYYIRPGQVFWQGGGGTVRSRRRPERASAITTAHIGLA